MVDRLPNLPTSTGELIPDSWTINSISQEASSGSFATPRAIRLSQVEVILPWKWRWKPCAIRSAESFFFQCDGGWRLFNTLLGGGFKYLDVTIHTGKTPSLGCDWGCLGWQKQGETCHIPQWINLLGCGFKYVLFSPLLGEDFQLD